MKKPLIFPLLASVFPIPALADCMDGRRAQKACVRQAIDCASVIDTAGRLACYDRVFRGASEPAVTDAAGQERVEAPVVTAEPVAAQPGAEPAVQPQREAVAPSDFGKREGVYTPVEYIEAKIVEVMTNRQKIDYIRLDNGQIWREIDDNRGVRYREGASIRIEDGILGSFNLKIDGLRKLIKVRRVR